MLKTSKFFVFFLAIFSLNACGTIASYKTAKITKSGKPEFTIGASLQKVPFHNKAYDDDPQNLSIVLPDFAIWSRLKSSNNKYDGGINFSIPYGVQGVLRRHLVKNKGYMPESTIGILGRRYGGASIIGDPLFYSSFTDIGFPVYLSWDVNFPKKWTIYTNFIPVLRRYKYDTAFDKSTYDFEEYLYGIQFTVGLKLWNIIIEYNTLTLNDNKFHTQTGIAYVF